MAISSLQIGTNASEILSLFSVVSPSGIHLMKWRCLADSGSRPSKSVHVLPPILAIVYLLASYHCSSLTNTIPYTLTIVFRDIHISLSSSKHFFVRPYTTTSLVYQILPLFCTELMLFSRRKATMQFNGTY